jgi:type IV secretory pathway VirB6-like protein
MITKTLKTAIGWVRGVLLLAILLGTIGLAQAQSTSEMEGWGGSGSPASAGSQSSSGNRTPSMSGTQAKREAARNIQGIVEEGTNVVKDVQGRMLEVGTRLATILLLIMLVWHAGQWVLEGGDITNVLGGVLRTVFLGALTYWFLTPFDMFGAKGQLPLVWFLDDVGTWAAGRMLRTGDGTLAGVAGDAFGSFYFAMNRITDVLDALFNQSTTWYGKVGDFFQYLVPIIYFLVAAVIMWVAGIAFFVMATIGFLMFSLGAMLAPLFIPFLLLPYMSYLFDSWLRFMISATMYKVAGAAVIALGTGIMDKTLGSLLTSLAGPVGAQDITGYLTEAGTAAVYGMMVAAVALSLAYLMLTLPSIAQGLISGSASVEMRKLMGSLGRAGQQTAGAALNAAGRGATAVGNIGRYAKATWQGAQTAWQGTKGTASAAAHATRTAALAAGLAYATGGKAGVGRMAWDATKMMAGGAANAAGSGIIAGGKAVGGRLRAAGGGMQNAGRNLIYSGTSSPAMKSIRSPARSGPRK